jgi:hypothetical protein
MVWYAANGFAAGIAMPFEPLLAVQPARSWQRSSTLSLHPLQKGDGRRGTDIWALNFNVS